MNDRMCSTCGLWGPETVSRGPGSWWGNLPSFDQCHLEEFFPELVATHGPEPIFTAPGHGCNAWMPKAEPTTGRLGVA